MPADASLTVREADASDLNRVATLLADNDLPHDDLGESPGQFFVGCVDETVVAAGGIELYGTAALLRSLVIAEAHRSEGYGTALCDELETVAVENGANALYLLTTTAPAFFRARGFDVTDRDTVPPRIQETTLFADHCPRSATCMEKSID
ncbi:arsenic resistance N-acetyltransferase ArsN2 [Halobacterium wangiae]|uniref:arsenic resistance N-acetyltransferase ArsN2 n=1 Tax=Halobacterium wangiae TaxID=2902623 RepID=UPI001E4D02C7|nr:arsenic resistance N-acetyltransferase ArsN2 [Halobacterium wangiae]